MRWLVTQFLKLQTPEYDSDRLQDGEADQVQFGVLKSDRRGYRLSHKPLRGQNANL